VSTAGTGSGDRTEGDAGAGRREAAQAPTNLRRATVWMAAGTAVSRFTGVLRVLALAFALGATHLATSYNLANTTPNMLYDVVLGGVLSATFIPVFVDRLATRSEREAWRAISSVITLSVAVLVAMTVVFWLLSGQVIDAFTALDHTHSAVQSAGLDQERAVATSLLRWFVPQVAFYGLIALATALLNTRRRFVAPMWVPIANNVVCIAVLLWFHHLVPDFPSLAGVEAHQGQLVLLGLGTTLGVVLQAVLLLPSLRAARLSRLRWRWDPRHEAVRTIVRLGSWTFGFVVANQVALFVVLALAVGVPASDPVSSYTYAYTFMQMPYAVVAVSVMSAVTPDLAQQWATGDMMAFRRRLAGGLRAVLAIILPAAMGMFLLAKPAVALLLGHGATSVASTEDTGAALALFSLGLPGFCTFLYVVRVLQSMQRTRVAFWLYLVENAINVVLAVALVHPLGVKGLALSLSIAYSIAAVAGVVVLRRWLGDLGGARTWAPLRRVGVATVVMGAVVLVVSNLSGADHGVGLLVRVVAAVVAGGLVYWAAISLLGGRDRHRDRRPRTTRARAGDRRPVASSRGPLPSPARPAPSDRPPSPDRPVPSGRPAAGPPPRRPPQGHVRPVPRPPAGPPPAPEGGRAG
jgi:putative peptidoglycan lipid II flippase